MIEHDSSRQRLKRRKEVDETVKEKNDDEGGEERMDTFSDVTEGLQAIGIGSSIDQEPESGEKEKPMKLRDKKGDTEVFSSTVAPHL